MVENRKISKRKAKAVETKDKIYNSAGQLFSKYGFEKVSVDSIVEMAGVSKGAFYVHFDSKDSLIAALIGDFVNKVDLDYKSYLKSFPADTASSDILMALAGKIADTIAFSIGYDIMKIVYDVQLTRTVSTEGISGYSRELYKIFSNIISQGVQQGKFKADIPVNIVTNHYILALRGLTYEWCIRYPDFDLKEQTLKHFDILLNGIKVQSP